MERNQQRQRARQQVRQQQREGNISPNEVADPYARETALTRRERWSARRQHLPGEDRLSLTQASVSSTMINPDDENPVPANPQMANNNSTPTTTVNTSPSAANPPPSAPPSGVTQHRRCSRRLSEASGSESEAE